ncbi:MAG: hypothetical protein K8F91_08320, partial [Candidatus Obscuribacterales bacterium]|nr:hypothetical protein [Candidatus Obscuribacterales bacterium]
PTEAAIESYPVAEPEPEPGQDFSQIEEQGGQEYAEPEAEPGTYEGGYEQVPIGGENIKPVADSKKDIARDKQEEDALKKLVKELEFGSLANSIAMLEKLTKTYPSDSDYTGLLKAARNLKDGDIWYRYQSRLQQAAPKVKETVPLIYTQKPAPVTVRINDLKHSSWLLMYKKLGSKSK